MAGVGADFWVCGDCRSVNKLRSTQCYNCRTPKDIAEVDPAAIEGTGHGKLREIALPTFHASRGEAMLASALIIGVAVLQVVSTVLDARLLGRIVDDPNLLTDPTFARSIDTLAAGTVALVTLGVALFALAAWALWLSRVVVAMPALGLGYPAATGLMAFVENFLPGLNLFRVPAIVRDVIRRLEPGSERGEVLIFAAWIGLFGGFLVPRIGGFLGAFGSGTLEDAVGQTMLIQGVSTGLVVVGAVFLVVLIWWIEERIARRRIAQLEVEPAPSAVGLSPMAAGLSPAAALAAVRTEVDSAGNTAATPQYAAASPPIAPVITEAPVVAEPPVAPEPPAPAEPPVVAEPPVPAEVPVMVEPPVAPEPPATMQPTPVHPPTPLPPPTPDAPMADAATAIPSASAVPLESAAPIPPTDPVLNRPITAVTGAASIPTESLIPPTVPTPAEAPPPPPTVPTPAKAPTPTWPIEAATATPPDAEHAPEAAARPESAIPVSAPIEDTPPVSPPEAPNTTATGANEKPLRPLRHAPTGPQLHLRIESATTMIGTFEGVSEPITLDDLRAAAVALEEADGSAVIATAVATFETVSLAKRAFKVLTDARVQTTFVG